MGKEIQMTRLIDADKLKAHYSWWKDGTREMTMGEAKDIFDEIVDLQPTAGKHAHWEWDDELGANICSSCGRPTYDSHDECMEFMERKAIALVTPYYCGYCGARMNEVTE